VLADQSKNIFDVIAGIDDHGFAGTLLSDDGAVTLQRSDGDNFVNHGGWSLDLGWSIVVSLTQSGLIDG
jgi:hypothetical protein